MEKLLIALQVYFDKNVKKLPERMSLAKTVYKYAMIENISSKENLIYDTKLYNDIILDLATDPNVLATNEIFYILKKFNQQTIHNPSPKSMIAFDNIIKNLSIYRQNDFKKAFLIISRRGLNREIHINENIMPFVTDIKYHNYPYRDNFLKEISSLNEKRAKLTKKLFDRHFLTLQYNLLGIAKIINEYKSNTRLESACNRMTHSNILEATSKTYQKTLETFNHFKNHNDQKQLLSCLDLWKRK